MTLGMGVVVLEAEGSDDAVGASGAAGGDAAARNGVTCTPRTDRPLDAIL